MIRSFLSLGSSKHILIHSEPWAAPLKIFSVRSVSVKEGGQAGKRRFTFSDEEVKRNAAVGPVPAHLSWEEAAVKCTRAQKEQVTESRIDLIANSQNLTKTQSYLTAIEILEGCPDIKYEEVEVLHNLWNRVKENYNRQSNLNANN